MSLLLAGMVGMFWWQDWQYSQPTPKPAQLFQPAFGAIVHLEPTLRAYDRPGKPLLLHFFNSDCPCSRFNIDHLRALKKQFGIQGVSFVAVVQGTPDQIRSFKKYELETPVVEDPDGRIAFQLGVYSTPQAVILTPKHELYFRGNYNLTRYCSDPRTEFVRLALEHLINGERLGKQPEAALIAYGCPLRKRAAYGR